MFGLLAALAKVDFFGHRIDVMGWLIAFGTVGAVGVALGLALLDWFRTQRAARRQQAELLTGWLGFGEEDVGRPVALRGIANTSGERVWTPGDKLVRRGGGWTGTDGKRLFRAVMLQNGSQQVVYRVIVALVNDPHGGGKGQSAEARTLFGEVPPGLTGSRIEIPGGEMSDRPKIEIAFVDYHGRPWIRWQGGTLQELKKDPPKHYGMTDLAGSDWG